MSVASNEQAWLNTLSGLLTYANGVTGESDTNIGDAVRTLADGYGQGGSLPSGILSITTTIHPVDWLDDTLGHGQSVFDTYMDTNKPTLLIASDNNAPLNYRLCGAMAGVGGVSNYGYRNNWTVARQLTSATSLRITAGTKITVIVLNKE